VTAAVLALRGVSDSVHAANKFHRAASFIETVYASTLSGGELIEIGNKQESTAFHVIAYLGAALRLPPAGAFRALCAVLPALRKLGKGMYCALVVPFVHSFWPVMFARAQFAFSRPQLVERQIAEALAIEGEASLLPLLAAVARGLDVSPPEKI
jgi:hypothetical protein